MKKVLLTRSPENSKELKDELISKGYEVIEEPLITFIPLHDELEKLDPIIDKYTLIITSNYSARLLASRYFDKELKCYVVGEVSAKILQHNGFKVLGLYPNVASLLENVPRGTKFLYPRGHYITHELNLRQKEVIIYNTEYKERFSPSVVSLFKNHKIQAVTIYSLKTEEAFLNCVKNDSLEEFVKHVESLRASPLVAKQ